MLISHSTLAVKIKKFWPPHVAMTINHKHWIVRQANNKSVIVKITLISTLIFNRLSNKKH